METKQWDTETRYSKSSVLKMIKTTLENRYKKKGKKLEESIIDYTNGEYYASKNLRMQLLKSCGRSPEEIVALMFLYTYQCNDGDKINKIASQLANALFPSAFNANLSNKSAYRKIKQAMTTASELLALMINADLLDAEGTSDGILIYSKGKVDKKVRKAVRAVMYLPPMVCKPRTIQCNSDSGYLSFDDHVVLKRHNQHGKPLALNILNKLNGTELRLNQYILSMDEVPSKPLKRKSQKRYFKAKVKQAKKVYKLLGDKEFHLLWKYDGRGRIYSQGYHVNFQGADYQRASIVLNKEVKLDNRGEFWLKVCAANKYGNGVDKLPFSERVEWFDKNHNSSSVLDKCDKPYQFLGMVHAYKHASKPSGILVGIDASSSGTQILAALSGCKKSLKLCNLIQQGDLFVDPPMEILKAMRKNMPKDKKLKKITRKEMKACYMTSLYGSRAEPKKLLGEGERLDNYYYVLAKKVPGVNKLIHKELFKCIDRKATEYWVTMPDYHTMHYKVRQKVDARIEIDELNHVKYTHRFSITKRDKHNVALVANITHAVDGMVVRQLIGRCNYNRNHYRNIRDTIKFTLAKIAKQSTQIASYGAVRLDMPAFNIEKINYSNASLMTVKELETCLDIVMRTMEHEPFELLTVHDEMFAHPNNMDVVIAHYLDIMSLLGTQKVMAFLLEQLGRKGYKMRNKPVQLTGKYCLS